MKSATKPVTTYQRIYRVVTRIPRGKVATYGQIARLAELPGQARLVGYALHSHSDQGARIPWHRVINARGQVSLSEFDGADLQRRLLEMEGITFDQKGRVDLARFQWKK
jgi:methylated-DNA-protein-cysteine methyltransferase-like protein